MTPSSTKTGSHPLDAYISGYAYENATTALGVLEEGSATKRRVSAEMFCTLDNFIKVVLFSERIFLYGVLDEKDGRVFPRDAIFGGSQLAKRFFDQADIFHSLHQIQTDQQDVQRRVGAVLAPLNPESVPWFVINCLYSKQPLLIIHQELVSTDAYFLEYLIDHAGIQRFKPIFPGEHLYLGLRRIRCEAEGPTRTVADLAGRRLRDLIRARIECVNKSVALMGYPPLPTTPPVFIASLLQECAQGSDLVPTLLEIRRSPAMTRFRQWAAQCEEFAASEDLEKRTRAHEAVDKLLKFSPQSDMSAKTFGKSVLNMIKDAKAFDVLGIVGEVLDPLLTYWGGLPLSGLRSFGGKSADPKHIEAFLQKAFHDKFNRSEMEYISTLLGLPDNLTDWKTLPVSFDVTAKRLFSQAPNLSRPCFFTTDDPVQTSKADKDFDALWEKAIPFEEALKEEVAETFRHLASKLIHFTPPDKMRLGLPLTLECHATKSLAQDLTVGMKERGLPEFEDVRVENVLGLSLRSEAFAVESREQASPASGGFRWTWQVTPRKTGTHLLQLIANVKIQIPMSSAALREYVVIEKNIAVKGGLLAHLKKVAGF
jgi:hypothetical protein